MVSSSTHHDGHPVVTILFLLSDCVICLWKLSTSKEVGNLTNDGDSLEHWTVTKMLR